MMALIQLVILIELLQTLVVNSLSEDDLLVVHGYGRGNSTDFQSYFPSAEYRPLQVCNVIDCFYIYSF